MSIKVMIRVWDDAEGVTAAGLLALLALADWAGEDGVCWPSMATLAKRMRTTRRNAARTLRTLEDDGHISRTRRKAEGGGNRSSLVTLTRYVPLVTPMSLGGDAEAPTLVTPASLPLVTPASPRTVSKNRKVEPEDIAEPIGPAATFAATVLSHLRDSLGGSRVAKSGGGALAWSGQIVGMLGDWTGDDADAACAIWDEFRRSDKWKFKGANPTAWPAVLGDWYTNERTPAMPAAAPYRRTRRMSEALAEFGIPDTDENRMNVFAWPEELVREFPDDARLFGRVLS